MSKLVSFTLGLLLTVAALFLVTGQDFYQTDIVAGIIYVLGVSVVVWATKTWYGR